MNASLSYQVIHHPLVDISPVTEHLVSTFNWEKFDIIWWRNWVFENHHLAFYVSGIYLTLIFTGQKLMQNRPAFNLNRELILWNAFLASFSILGFTRSLPEFAYNLLNGGVYGSSCLRPEVHSYTTAFWGLVFLLSKLVELGDTAFLVLRKRKVLFLHWYHHITVLLYCWRSYPPYDPMISYFSFINYMVHSCMYTYFTFTAGGIKPPRNLAKSITVLQLSQMVVGLFVCFYSIAIKAFGGFCANDYNSIYSALAMYFSYLILFADFFRRAYLKGGKEKGLKSE